METSAKFYEQTASDREVMTRMNGRFVNGINNLFVGVGWTSLLVEMEQRLSAIDPDYTLLSIVDRDGQMRITFDASRPYSDAGMAEDEWVAAQIAADQRHERMADIAHEIELKSTTVCEMTGEAGVPTYMDGRTYVLSAKAAAYYAALDAEDDETVVFDFPEFIAVFEFDGEPAEETVLSESEVRILASLGRKSIQTGTGQPDEESGITIGHIDFEECEGTFTIDGTEYTVEQIADLVANGIHGALSIALRDILRDAENPEHGD